MAATERPDLGPYWDNHASLELSVASVANQQWNSVVPILHRTTQTGIMYVVGSAQGGNVKAAIYDSTGARVANDTGTHAMPAANTGHKVPFDAAVMLDPGLYCLALVFSTATGSWRGGTRVLLPSSQQAIGSFNTAASITFPTTVQTSSGPAMTTY